LTLSDLRTSPEQQAGCEMTQVRIARTGSGSPQK